MARRARFSILYAPEVARHVQAVEAKHYKLIRRAIYERLSFAPGERTRNRKPLEDLPGRFDSTWELRCGPAKRFRVFYEIARDTRQVWVLAIGVNDRDRLLIAGEEFDP
jgi:mRNA-degrading endonuclease RelE of RelBE toxin-antitoxin system